MRVSNATSETQCSQKNFLSQEAEDCKGASSPYRSDGGFVHETLYKGVSTTFLQKNKESFSNQEAVVS